MTKDEKLHLQYSVEYHLENGKTHKEIISRLTNLGFKKATIKNYIKAFAK